MQMVVGYGLNFTCPACQRIVRRVSLSRNLFIYAVPKGHKVGKDNRITCFYGEKPVIWQVFFTKD